jgi:hypothetical protein
LIVQAQGWRCLRIHQRRWQCPKIPSVLGGWALTDCWLRSKLPVTEQIYSRTLAQGGTREQK